MTAMAYMTLFERRVISALQLRIGPNRVAPSASFQPRGAAFKLSFKEAPRPPPADRLLSPMAPAISLVAALAAFPVIPIGPTLRIGSVTLPLQIQDLPVGLIYLVAV